MSRESLSVRVPGSSANLGPGFDVLGMAVSIHADMGVVDAHGRDHSLSDHASGDHSSGQPSPAIVEGRHPALVAFRAVGGRGDLWVKCPIPSGRGLGFSGAMRVGGVALGLAERAGVIGGELPSFILENRPEILNHASGLEGHADNAAASLLGGIVACTESGGQYAATNVPLESSIVSEAHIVVWVPHEQTATAESRASLASEVPRGDAVFNMARLAQLVIALGSGDRVALEAAVQDRLHQDQRLKRVPMSRAALEVMHTSGATACWLSGSGPTVAALVFPGSLEAVESELAVGELAQAGRTMRLGIDTAGLHAAR